MKKLLATLLLATCSLCIASAPANKPYDGYAAHGKVAAVNSAVNSTAIRIYNGTTERIGIEIPGFSYHRDVYPHDSYVVTNPDYSGPTEILLTNSHGREIFDNEVRAHAYLDVEIEDGEYVVHVN